MLRDNKIWVATKATGEAIYLLPQKAIRHGLITGGNNKEVDRTARLLAEGFSSLGTPVFITDIHRDLAGLVAPGNDSEFDQEIISHMGLQKSDFCFQGFPVTLWDVCGKTGIPLRANVGEIGPDLLSQILHLGALQSKTLKTIFRIANDQELLLFDVTDLKAWVNYIESRVKQFERDYGLIKKNDLDDIMRALVKLETEATAPFWGEPSLNIIDLMNHGIEGKGMINVLDSNLLVRNCTFYASVLLWLLSELCELMPDVGELSSPKMVFIIDEAHLLFRDNNKIFLEKSEQVIKKLGRKGVCVIFCTQKMLDIPDNVLRYLENRILHSPYAYTPAQLKELRIVAGLFRKNPAFNTFDALKSLTAGEALFSLIGENNQLCPVEKGYLLPPQSYMGHISDSDRENCNKGNLLYTKYAHWHDPDAAYDLLKLLEIEADAASAAEKAKQELALERERAKTEAIRAEEEDRKVQVQANARKYADKPVGKSLSTQFKENESEPPSKKASKSHKGKFGKTIGGNLGASLGKGLIGSLFKD